MKQKKLLLACFIVFLNIAFSLSLFSSEKMRIAVLELKPEGVAKKTSKIITNMLRTDMINIGKFIVIERTQVDEIMKEQGFQRAGCTDQKCAVQLGKILSAKKILIGEVSSIGKAIIITVRIVDVEKGISEYAARQKAPMDTIDVSITKISKELSRRIKIGLDKDDPEIIDADQISTGYYLRGLIPGWGQLYSERATKGFIFLGAFVLSGAYMGYTINNYNVKRDEYTNLPAGSSPDVFKDKHNTAADASNNAKIAMGIFSTIYLVNILDILFFSTPGKAKLNENASIIKFNDSFFTFNIYRDSSHTSVKSNFNNERRINMVTGIHF